MKPNLDPRDLGLRFILGGSAVAACYLMLQIIPSQTFAGIFAAFPAVMVAAVTMAGIYDGSQQAADVAFGATAGMLGCTVCVVTAIIGMIYLHNLILSLILATLAWFFSAVFFIRVVQNLQRKSKNSVNR